MGGMLNFVSNLLVGWAPIFKKPDGAPSYIPDYSWMGQIFDVISIVLWIVMGLVGAAGAIYAIWLGINLARAEDQSKRDEARKHLIYVLVAVAVTVVLVLFFNLLLPEIVKAFVGTGKDGTIYDLYKDANGGWKAEKDVLGKG